MFAIVTIKDLRTNKKYKVEVEFRVDRHISDEIFILQAIDYIVHDLTKGSMTKIINDAGRIFVESRNFKDFIETLEAKLKLKAKLKRM